MGGHCSCNKKKTEKQAPVKQPALNLEVFSRDQNAQNNNDMQSPPINGSVSFLKEPIPQRMSIQIYGEDISRFNSVFLRELRDLNESNVRISKQELLLTTMEDSELLNLIKFKEDKNTTNNLQSSSNDRNLNFEKNKKSLFNQYPDFLMKRFAKIGSRHISQSLNSQIKEEDSQILSTSFMEFNKIESEEYKILKNSSVINEKGLRLDVWDPDVHELVDNHKLTCRKAIDDKLQELAISCKACFKEQVLNIQDKTISVPNNQMIPSLSNVLDFGNPSPSAIIDNQFGFLGCPLIASSTPRIYDLIPLNFKNKSISALLQNIINYDSLFETSILRKLMFPQISGLPYISKSKIVLLKVNYNGTRRAVPILLDKEVKGLTLLDEQYPFAFEKGLMSLFLNNKVAPQIHVLLYRLIGWIPEKMSVEDVGDVLSSFDKLRDTLSAGNLLLFWQENLNESPRPVLSFISDKNSLNRFLKTISLDFNNKDPILLDWEELYRSGKIKQLMINWNPTIYPYRHSVHVPITINTNRRKNKEHTFYFQETGQVLLQLKPHKSVSETRVLIDRHRSVSNVFYRIKYYLFSFLGGRIALPTGSLREMEISESTEEVLSDIIIFDENSLLENYVIAIELEPEDESSLLSQETVHQEVVTLSLYTFVEFEAVEFPFFECRQIENRIYRISEDESEVLYKMTIFNEGNYELRVEGEQGHEYSLLLYHFQKWKNIPVNQNSSFKSASEAFYGALALPCYFEQGTYIVRFRIETVQSSSKNSLSRNKSDTPVTVSPSIHFISHEIRFSFISFGKGSSRVNIGNSSPSSSNFFKVEEYKSPKVEMKVSNYTGVWNRLVNRGITKAKVKCLQKYMYNPGVITRAEEETDIKFKLKSIGKNSTSVPFISLCILLIKDDFTFELIWENELFEQVSEIVSDTLVIRPGRFGLLALALCLDPNYNGQWEIETTSSLEVKSRVVNGDFLNLISKQRVLGELKIGCGGHLNSFHFLLNTAYKLVVSADSNPAAELFIEITSPTSSTPVSIYLIPSNKDILLDLSQNELCSADFNPAFLYDFNSLYKTITAGTYIVVPSSVDKLNKVFDFELKISCSEKFSLSPLPSISLNLNVLKMTTETSESRLCFQIKKPAKILLLIQPEIVENNLVVSLIDRSLSQKIFEESTPLRLKYFITWVNLFDRTTIYDLVTQTRIATKTEISLFASETDLIKEII